MNEYKTRNGATVYLDSGGRLKFQRDSPICANTLEDFWVQAAREFFQAERDEQLGRWRDPQNPDMVCYPVAGDLDAVWVLSEGGGLPYIRERNQAFYVGNKFSEVARRYFTAHPEPEPRPWEEAETGEVWVLTRWGIPEPFLVTGGEFASTDLAVIVDLDSDSITAGRRIWPEGEDK